MDIPDTSRWIVNFKLKDTCCLQDNLLNVQLENDPHPEVLPPIFAAAHNHNHQLKYLMHQPLLNSRLSCQWRSATRQECHNMIRVKVIPKQFKDNIRYLEIWQASIGLTGMVLVLEHYSSIEAELQLHHNELKCSILVSLRSRKKAGILSLAYSKEPEDVFSCPRSMPCCSSILKLAIPNIVCNQGYMLNYTICGLQK